MKKIFDGIINFFKLLFLALISPFVKDKKDKKEEVQETIKSEKVDNIKRQKEIPKGGTDTAIPPDEDNMKTNPHDETSETGEAESTRIYSLPRDLGRVLNVNEKYSYLAFSDEEIDELINDELEDTYKEEQFKIYKINSIIRKKVEKFKKEVVPIIKDRIYYNNITDEKKLKKEIKEIVAEQLEIMPILPKKEVPQEKEHKDIEPYFIAIPRKKELDLPDLPLKLNTEDKIAEVESKEEVDKKIDNTPLMMVKNTDVIPEPTFIQELPKLAVATAITAAKEVAEIIAAPLELPKLKEEPKKEEEKKTEVKVEPIVDAPPEVIEEEVMTIEEETEEIVKEVEEVEKEVDETIKESEVQQEKTEERIEEVKEEEEDIKEEIKVKEVIPDKKINNVSNEVTDIIEEANKEANKRDFFEKDYDTEEKKLDRMLDKIEETRIKYGDKLTRQQKEKLNSQEKKLRTAKDKLLDAKERDIAFEKKELESEIKEVEINGLQQEIKSMHLEYNMETNNRLLEKMDKLEDMTKEQVADIDRKMMMKRFNKASRLLEVASIFALPFIRNKYFSYFTIGLIVDNHLGLTHAFLNRKANRYQPVDLDSIKKGQDALDGAIDLAYKDLVELDYIEEQALTKYPQLADDPGYQASITRVRNNLTNQFNKLVKKQNTMERYLHRGLKQKKVLEKREAAA